jgi:DNA-binding transcriptional LysR family regulator
MFIDDLHTKIRALDMDDLLILSLLHEGFSSKHIANFLMLTPPAISHRYRKYDRLTGVKIFTSSRGFRKCQLTEEAKVFTNKAKEAYLVMLEADKRFVVGSLFHK